MQHDPSDSTQRKLLRSLSYFSVRLKYVERKSFFGLSGRQVLLLASLCSFDAAPTLTELSEANGASHQNIKQLLLKLEKAGYATLRSDERDNRMLIVEATDQAESWRRSTTGSSTNWSTASLRIYPRRMLPPAYKLSKSSAKALKN